jgi:hypothetical protein
VESDGPSVQSILAHQVSLETRKMHQKSWLCDPGAASPYLFRLVSGSNLANTLNEIGSQYHQRSSRHGLAVGVPMRRSRPIHIPTEHSRLSSNTTGYWHAIRDQPPLPKFCPFFQAILLKHQRPRVSGFFLPMSFPLCSKNSATSRQRAPWTQAPD